MHRFAASILVTVALAVLAGEAFAAGFLVPRNGSAPIAVESHRVVVEMDDGLAKTTLRQTFVNHRARALEAVYVFPLPEHAALVDVAMETGGVRLEGLLVERKKARRIYDEIVRSRRDPALVEQIGRNRFRLSVFPVLPDQPTVVELTWIERIPLRGGTFRYEYPLALGPGAAETEQDFTFEIRMRSALPFESVTSPNADLEILRTGPGEAVASMERVHASLDEDVVVEARVEVTKPTLRVRTFRREDGDGWFVAVVTPPKAREEDLLPRDVILCVDTSGSMRGAKIEQARAATLYLLENLRDADRVNLLRFSSACEAFAPAPVPATAENREKLAEFATCFEARGGTALGDALSRAIEVPPAEGRVRTVVLLTDGLPTVGERDPEKLVSLGGAAAEKGLRVFTFGVGDDVDPSLLAGIARAGRGAAEVFRPEGEIESRLRSFLDRTASPVISDLRLSAAGIALYDLFPRPRPDAYLGEQVVLAGRYRGGGKRRVTVTGNVRGRVARLSGEVDFRPSPGGPPSVARAFAWQKLEFLSDILRIRSGLGDDAFYAALDRGRYDTQDEIVEEIVDVSIEHRVQSPFTSFLVLLPQDRERIRPGDMLALRAALERARLAREEIAPAGTDHGGEPPTSPFSPAPPTPLGPLAASPSTPGGVSTGQGRRVRPRPMTFDNWLFWWAYNKDEIFSSRRRAGADEAPPRSPEDAEAVARIAGALARVLANPGIHPDIRGGAAIALARCPPSPETERILLSLAANRDENQILRESAVLGLAMTPGAGPEVRRALRTIADDTTDRWRVRCFALVALGLTGDRSDETFEVFLRRIDGSEVRQDLPVCAFLAIGLAGDPARVPTLLGWLETGLIDDHRIDDLERAWLIEALGRIGRPEALPAVRRALRGKRLYARRSAAIAMGRLLPRVVPEDRLEDVRRLWEFVRSERDITARNFAVLSLGRTAAAPDSPEELRATIERALTQEFRDSNKVTERPHAALALGLLALDGADRERVARIAGEIRPVLEQLKGDKIALGAQALALGMIGDDSPETIRLLVAILRDRGLEKKLRGSAAMALGLLGHPDGRDPILGALGEREDRDLRIDTALAAGMLGDARAVPLLTDVLDDPKASQFVLGSVALALGRLADLRSADSLLRILEPDAADGQYPDLTRALVAVALGHLARGDREPVLSRISRDVNYRATVGALDEILTIL